MLSYSRRAALAAMLAAALATAAGCSSSGSAPPAGGGAATPSAAGPFPVTLRAANGTVTINSKPTAIVSLSPTATEMLFAIGAGNQVKAVDENSDYPARAPHTNLNAFQLNAEAVAKYRPDLVIASNLTKAQINQLDTLHITTLLQPAAQNLTQSYAEITALGRATGHTAGAAREVATMRREISAIVRSTPRHSKPLTYYYELDQTYYSETSSTFIGHALRLLGLTSIADSAKGVAASGGYPQLSAEYILKSNPDYVFLADTKCCKQSPATVAKRPGWSTLSAVRHGRVVRLDDDIASRWGPRIVSLLRTISVAIKKHPVR